MGKNPEETKGGDDETEEDTTLRGMDDDRRGKQSAR